MCGGGGARVFYPNSRTSSSLPVIGLIVLLSVLMVLVLFGVVLRAQVAPHSSLCTHRLGAPSPDSASVWYHTHSDDVASVHVTIARV